jgi:surface carbohydrate biosynthesis protein
MNIYMRMIIPAREYFAKLLLGVIAASRGHHVLLGELPKIARGFPPGIYHTNDLGFRKARQLSKLASAGFIITAQDEEHGLTEESLDYTIATRFHESTLAHVSASFSWGPWDYAALRARFPDSATKFQLTGSPRVDLWRRDVGISPFIDRRAEALRTSEAPTVLIISNFGPQPTPWWMAAGHTRGSHIGMSFRDRIEFMDLLAGYQRTAIVFTEAVHALSDEFPDARIVVRPHPTETWGALAELIGPRPNVLVTRSGTTTEWLRAADLMIHSGSTTAFEAVIGGSPALAYTPAGLNHEFITNHISRRAQSITELLEVTGSIIGESAQEPEESVRETVTSRIFMHDHTMAAAHIVDHWEQLAADRALPGAGLHRTARSTLLKTRAAARLKRPRASVRMPESRKIDPEGGEIAQVDRDESVRFPPFCAQDVIADATAMADVLETGEIGCRLLSERLILLTPSRRSTPFATSL